MVDKSNNQNYAEMDTDQLIKTVKDRDKKLKKVESKFVEVHEARRLLKQDRDTFLNFLTLIFPEPTINEVLLPDDQIGSYDIDHLRQFWQLQQAKMQQEKIQENFKLQTEITELKGKVATQHDENQNVEVLQAEIKVLQQSDVDLKAENARIT